MGRPINKKHLGDNAGAIQVTAYYRAGGSEVAGQDDTYIVSQRSTNKFLVADTSGAWSEVLTLADSDQGSLAEGEFIINAVDANGVTKQVTRLYNRTLRLSGDVKTAWNISAATEGTITGATAADPCVITSTAHGLSTADKIAIRNVAGMVELNVDTAFTITVVDANSFSLDGIDSTGYTAYTSGGTWVLQATAGTAVIDVQGA